MLVLAALLLRIIQWETNMLKGGLLWFMGVPLSLVVLLLVFNVI